MRCLRQTGVDRHSELEGVPKQNQHTGKPNLIVL